MRLFLRRFEGMPHLSQVAAVLLALAPPIGPCSRRQPCFFCRIHSVRGLCNSTVGGGVDESQPPPVDQGRQNPPKIDNPSTASSQDQAPTPAASPPAGVPTSPILPPAKEPTGPLSMLSPLTGVGTQPWVPSTFTITFDTNHVMLLRRTHRPSTGGGGGEENQEKGPGNHAAVRRPGRDANPRNFRSTVLKTVSFGRSDTCPSARFTGHVYHDTTPRNPTFRRGVFRPCRVGP